MELSKYKSVISSKINKLLIPITNFGFNEEGIKSFNEIYQYCLDLEDKGLLKPFIATSSGGISTSRDNRIGARWTLSITSSLLEIVLKDLDGKTYRFIIGYAKNTLDKNAMSGRKAFILYKKELEKDGINLEDLAISDGKEIKKTIPSPKIELDPNTRTDRPYLNAHHIDLNSAYNAGMSEAFPILRKSVERMYSKRKENEKYKAVLNMTQGFMQSRLVNYKYSHISKAGYEYTLKRLDDLTKRLTDAGYRILSYNTDGIWYQSPYDNPEPFHDIDEGKELGQWKNDHTFCTIRYKSKGCYEFKDKDGYHPVFRGCSSYEKIKPREEWEWGDIFKGEEIQYKFIKGKGIVEYVCTEL